MSQPFYIRIICRKVKWLYQSTSGRGIHTELRAAQYDPKEIQYFLRAIPSSFKFLLTRDILLSVCALVTESPNRSLQKMSPLYLERRICFVHLGVAPPTFLAIALVLKSCQAYVTFLSRVRSYVTTLLPRRSTETSLRFQSSQASALLRLASLPHPGY